MFATAFCRVAFTALLVVPFLGCNGDRSRTAVVRGKITYNGKPVPNGTVNFVPASGTASTGEIQPDGSYALTTYTSGDGAIPGKHRVVIIAVEDTSSRLPEERNPLPAPIVPIKYTSIATSDLRAVVEDKENTINFDLRDEKSM